MAFCPRSGRGHVHSPTTINYRANIAALKRVGVTDVISVSACGSFREELPPGHFVLADQFSDRPHAPETRFLARGSGALLSPAAPVCPRPGTAPAATKTPARRAGWCRSARMSGMAGPMIVFERMPVTVMA